MPTILADPYIVEEELPLQVALDCTAFDITAGSVSTLSEYSAKTSAKEKQRVLRVAWVLPMLRADQSTGGVSKFYSDSRGRLVTPLSYSIRATNVSSERLVWHVNTPYQEGDTDGVIVARVGDKVVELKPGQSRVHSHAWGNGSHFFPLRGLLAETGASGDPNACCALADFFFLRDKYGASNLVVNPEHDLVRVEVSVKYQLDRANDVDSDGVEIRKPIYLVDLHEFDALYHVDPLLVTAAGTASPVFTTPATNDPYLQVLADDGNKIKLVSVNVAGVTTNVTEFRGVPNGTGSTVQVLSLHVTYKDRSQSTFILNTFAKSSKGTYQLLGMDGEPAEWTQALDKFRVPTWCPCLFYRKMSPTYARSIVLSGGRLAMDKRALGVVPWPTVIAFALAVGTKILSLWSPNGGRSLKSKQTTKTKGTVKPAGGRRMNGSKKK